MKKIIVALFIFLALGLSSSAFAEEKILTIGITNEPEKLNPILAPGIYGEALAGNIFDTLVSYKENLSIPAPGLAETWEISEDGKQYTFHLREGVTFHNGDPLTAGDVKFTIETIMDPANASPGKEVFSQVEKVESAGDYTVRITLKNPYAPFLLALGTPTSGILPKKVVTDAGMDKFGRKPVGTGPFRFVEWTPSKRIVLEKNPDYFLGMPNVDKVIFRPIPKPEKMAAEIESGGIDIAHKLLTRDEQKLKGNKNLNVQTIPGHRISYMGFSYNKAPFSDIRFRKAIYHSLPIDAAIGNIWRGMGTRSYSWIPSGVFPEDTQYMTSKALPFDREKAAQLFEELKNDGIIKDGMEFSIYTTQTPYRVKIATAVANELKKYGILANVESLEWGTLFPLLKGGVGMYIMGWGSVPDPDRWTYKIFHSKSTMNFSKYSNPEIDSALDLGRSLVGNEKRGKQYIRIMRTALAEDYIHIPLFFKNVTTISNKKVKGFAPSPQGYFHLMSETRNVSVE